MRFVAVTFGILGIYVGIESLKKLILIEVPEPSVPGLVIAVLSLITMPILAVRKRAIGREIKSRALIADSNETIACAFLSLALLAGLGGRYFFGFWQADPIAALIIVVFLFHEGYRGWREACNEKSD
jgi:divalent metal cation (Fe/Co/Zn/Cd) transporter